MPQGIHKITYIVHYTLTTSQYFAFLMLHYIHSYSNSLKWVVVVVFVAYYYCCRYSHTAYGNAEKKQLEATNCIYSWGEMWRRALAVTHHHYTSNSQTVYSERTFFRFPPSAPVVILVFTLLFLESSNGAFELSRCYKTGCTALWALQAALTKLFFKTSVWKKFQGGCCSVAHRGQDPEVGGCPAKIGETTYGFHLGFLNLPPPPQIQALPSMEGSTCICREVHVCVFEFTCVRSAE